MFLWPSTYISLISFLANIPFFLRIFRGGLTWNAWISWKRHKFSRWLGKNLLYEKATSEDCIMPKEKEEMFILRQSHCNYCQHPGPVLADTVSTLWSLLVHNKAATMMCSTYYWENSSVILKVWSSHGKTILEAAGILKEFMETHGISLFGGKKKILCWTAWKEIFHSLIKSQLINNTGNMLLMTTVRKYNLYMLDNFLHWDNWKNEDFKKYSYFPFGGNLSCEGC